MPFILKKKKRRRENLLGSKEELEGFEIRSLKEQKLWEIRSLDPLI